jgi:hypothetical protein
MANAVSQHEAGDVLSSVKRLVGETKTEDHMKAAPNAFDKLVLTPQFRVAEPEVLTLRAEDAVEDVETSEAPLVLSNKLRERRLQRTDVSELTAKIAALETAIAKTVDQWEPDGTGRDAYAGTQSPSMPWQDDIELDATGTPAQTAAVTEAAETVEPPVLERAEEALDEAVEEQLIDEEVLRSIVVEIVRSELQGALGERITRNVRKLVRREIHRALVAKSLE